MLVLREKTNHISIWIFIINIMKGVSLSTHLKAVFYMKCWIPSTSCSFQLTQSWCTLTCKTDVYRNWFRDSDAQLNSGHCQIDQLHSVLRYTNKLYEENKKPLLIQTLHRKTLKLLRKIKTFFRLRWATNFASLGKLLRSYFVTIIRRLHYSFSFVYSNSK